SRVDVALGLPRRSLRALGPGGAGSADAVGGGPEAAGDRLLCQPARGQARRGRAGASPRHRGALHPRPGGVLPVKSPVTLPQDYFDDMYTASSDPWEFETRWY